MRIFACLLLGLAVLPAWGADAVAEIAARLGNPPVLRAHFSQTKEIATMRRPLKLSGQFLHARGQGVVWQVETPYRAGFVIGPRGMVELSAEGVPRPRNPGQAGAYAQVGEIFRALLGADLLALRDEFSIDAETGPRWRATLTPRRTEVARHLKHIRLSGSDHVETVEVLEASGDRSLLKFSNLRREPPLSAAEAALFTP